MATSFLNQSGLPIGLRNNNPGNLRVSSDTWLGEIGSENGFVTFSDLTWGVRAMATVTANDINQGLNTLALYITHYAPPSENDTAAYIANMSAATGFSPGQVLPSTLDTIRKIIVAQMGIELGQNYAAMVPAADIDQGLKLMNSTLLSIFTDVGQTVESGAKTPASGGLLALTLIGLTLFLLPKAK